MAIGVKFFGTRNVLLGRERLEKTLFARKRVAAVPSGEITINLASRYFVPRTIK